jgi:hypothetical protein
MSRAGKIPKMENQRQTMDRRRFLKDSLGASASGLLFLFGLTGRAGQQGPDSPERSSDFSRTAEELAG